MDKATTACPPHVSTLSDKRPRQRASPDGAAAGPRSPHYPGYFDDLQAAAGRPKVFKPGRGYHPQHFDTLSALSVTDIPNDKTDVNIKRRWAPFRKRTAATSKGTKRRVAASATGTRDARAVMVPAERRKCLRNTAGWPTNCTSPRTNSPTTDISGSLCTRGRHLSAFCSRSDITGRGQEVRRHADAIAVGEFPIDSFLFANASRATPSC